MAKFRPPDASIQVDFFRRLQELRNEILLDALLQTLAVADSEMLDSELHRYVPVERLQVMRGLGLASELAFVTPYLLKLKPRLLGYYRLLLGLSQKAFYSQGGFGLFASMEAENRLSNKQEALLPDLCLALIESAWQLIRGINEPLGTENIRELTILTLGPQLRGSRNVGIGSAAVRRVFDLLKETVALANPEVGDRTMELANAAGRKVVIEFAEDPDVRIREELASGDFRKIVSMEIKGGTDVSNLHNRLGEAEKSHLKAKGQGFTTFWTILSFKGFDLKRAQTESPTTTIFFDIGGISDSQSQEGRKFRELVKAAIGI